MFYLISFLFVLRKVLAVQRKILMQNKIFVDGEGVDLRLDRANVLCRRRHKLTKIFFSMPYNENSGSDVKID